MNRNVFENVYLFETINGNGGIVRADNEDDAIERILDRYSGLEYGDVHVIKASSVDNDYGVVNFEDAVRMRELNKTINDKLYDAIDDIFYSIQSYLGITDGGCDPFDENKLDEVRHELADVMEKIIRYQFNNNNKKGE